MKYYYEPASLHDLIQHSEKNYGKLPYVHEYINGSYQAKNYQEFINDVRRVACLLNELGYRGKDIILCGKNSYEWMVTYMAITAYVGVCICAGKDCKRYDMKGVVSVAVPSLVICDQDLEQYIDSVKFQIKNLKDLICESKKLEIDKNLLASVAVKKQDISVIIFTTGTTGKPKAVPLSLANMFTCGASLYDKVLITPKDSYFLFLPLHHIYCQFGIMLAAFDIGSSLYLSTDPHNIASEMQAGRPTIIPGVPLFFERIINEIGDKDKKRIINIIYILDKFNASMWLRRRIFRKVHRVFGGNIKFMESAAACLDEKTKRLYIGMGLNLVEAYGMSEAAGVIAMQDIHEKPVAGSIGRVLSPQKIKINNPAPDGYGEIAIKGGNITSGYLVDGKIDKSEFDDKGYFLTGDEGYIDEDGNLFIRGRISKIIVLSSGEKVSVDEITGLLKSKKGIDRVYLREKDGYLDATIFSHQSEEKINAKVESLNESLAKCKQIKSWALVDDYILSEIKK